MSNAELSEFFNLVSKEKNKNLDKIRTEINNPKSDLGYLFEQLEDAHKQTTKSSEDFSEEKNLTEEDQNKLEVFSNLMSSIDSAKKIPEEVVIEVQPELIEPIEEIEPIVEPEEVVPEEVVPEEVVPEEVVPEEAIKTDDIIQEIVNTLDDMGRKTEVKEEIDQITLLRREFEKFKNHIQQHISKQDMSGGGSGEVRLEFLDDIQRSTAKVDGKYLKYSSSDGKWIGATVASETAADDISAGDAAISITTTSGNITIDAAANNTDIIFKGTDASADITMLTLDGSEAGAATFNDKIVATELDISGNVDVDGTLETDALTIDGATLAETIADTVGAMVTSNTETGITVTYEDGDNTLDFVIGTLNQNTSGTADNFTVSANNSTDETVYPVFVDGSTGSQGAESDTGLTYNPSTGLLTSTGFSGNLTGTLQTAAQGNVTSVGTLTGLVIADAGNIGSASDTDALAIDSSGNVTASQNLTVTGDFTVNGTTTTVSTTNIVVEDNLIGLNDGAATNANDSGIIIERGSTGDNAIIHWDESADKFQVGTTTAVAGDTGNLTVTTGTLVANIEGNVTGDVTGNASGTAATVTGAAQSNITSVGTLTSIVIADAGNIGSVSDTDAIAISSGGVVTFSQAPVFPDGSIDIDDLDIDGGTDIGAALTDSDLLVVDDGAGGTNRKTTMARVKTYIGDPDAAATAMAVALG